MSYQMGRHPLDRQLLPTLSPRVTHLPSQSLDSSWGKRHTIPSRALVFPFPSGYSGREVNKLFRPFGLIESKLYKVTNDAKNLTAFVLHVVLSDPDVCSTSFRAVNSLVPNNYKFKVVSDPSGHELHSQMKSFKTYGKFNFMDVTQPDSYTQSIQQQLTPFSNTDIYHNQPPRSHLMSLSPALTPNTLPLQQSQTAVNSPNSCFWIRIDIEKGNRIGMLRLKSLVQEFCPGINAPWIERAKTLAWIFKFTHKQEADLCFDQMKQTLIDRQMPMRKLYNETNNSPNNEITIIKPNNNNNQQQKQSEKQLLLKDHVNESINEEATELVAQYILMHFQTLLNQEVANMIQSETSSHLRKVSKNGKSLNSKSILTPTQKIRRKLQLKSTSSNLLNTSNNPKNTVLISCEEVKNKVILPDLSKNKSNRRRLRRLGVDNNGDDTDNTETENGNNTPSKEPISGYFKPLKDPAIFNEDSPTIIATDKKRKRGRPRRNDSEASRSNSEDQHTIGNKTKSKSTLKSVGEIKTTKKRKLVSPEDLDDQKITVITKPKLKKRSYHDDNVIKASEIILEDEEEEDSIPDGNKTSKEEQQEPKSKSKKEPERIIYDFSLPTYEFNDPNKISWSPTASGRSLPTCYDPPNRLLDFDGVQELVKDQEDFEFLKEALKETSPNTKINNVAYWAFKEKEKKIFESGLNEPIGPIDIPDSLELLEMAPFNRANGYMTVPESEKARYLPHRKNIHNPLDTLQEHEDESSVGAGVTTTQGRRKNARRIAVDLNAQKQQTNGGEAELFTGNLLQKRKKAVRFARSAIHNWGLYAQEPIYKGEMVIEYVGEVIRPQIAALRENKYDRSGLGSSYLFRIDDQVTIDATKTGGIARFINHCCTPNCKTKIIKVEGQKKIVIYAIRDIGVNEELSYDYKFDKEADKSERIPCLCGSVHCKGYLN